MALSAFDDKAKQPEDLDHRDAETFLCLVERTQETNHGEFTPLSFEWGFAGKAYGWGLRLKHKKRTVLYMTPCECHFLASFALGEKAVKSAHNSDLPTSIPGDHRQREEVCRR